MSVTSVLDKINNLAIQTEIADLSELASGLLEKAPKARGKNIKDVVAVGHRRYPHLVPMYRQVHRKIPRPKTFKAIRWVNPKRMFPGAGLTKEEMMKKSNAELEKLVVDLNTYREEAHVIHNRYNQMIDLIERGQLPYYIPYAGITEPSWLKLEGHMGRAKRLKAGTEAWEKTLDVQAADIRSILLMKDREGGPKKFDQIDGLWEAPDGQPRAPMFMDVKKPGQAMRKQRTHNGERLNVKQDAYARRFMAVRSEDIGEGEAVGMPAEGNWIDPTMVRDPAHRAILEAQGAAGMHLLRIPKVPWMMTGPQQRELHQNGQLISIPPGRDKHPVAVFFDRVPANAVADRPFAKKPPGAEPDREPQAEPQAAAAERRERDRDRRRAERVARDPDREARREQANLERVEREKALREKQRERNRQLKVKEQEAREGMAQRDALPTTQIRAALDDINKKGDQLLEDWNNERYRTQRPEVPTNLFGDGTPLDPNEPAKGKNPTSAGFTTGPLTGGPQPTGKGIRASMNLTVQIDGKPYIYKVVPGESRGEKFAFMVDRAMGLGSVPAIHLGQLGMKALTTAFNDTHGEGAMEKYNEPFLNAVKGGGHFMEFCDTCVTPGKASNIIKEMMKTKEGRNEFNKLTLLDFVSGNHDRHGNNWFISQDGKVIAIDNALSNMGQDPTEVKRMHIGDGGRQSGINRADWSDVKDADGSEITKAKLAQEAGEFFDEHFNNNTIDMLQNAAAATNAKFTNSFSDVEIAGLRSRFIMVSADNFRTPLDNFKSNWPRN